MILVEGRRVHVELLAVARAPEIFLRQRWPEVRAISLCAEERDGAVVAVLPECFRRSRAGQACADDGDAFDRAHDYSLIGKREAARWKAGVIRGPSLRPSATGTRRSSRRAASRGAEPPTR